MVTPIELPRDKDGANGQFKRTLEVCHESLSATVQGIYDHLAVSGARDFDPAVF